MKLSFLVVIIVSVFSAYSYADMPSQRLVDALIIHESGKVGGDDSMIGDLDLKNHAYGCLQIRQPACDHLNDRYHTHYCAKDCLNNRALSIEICNRYINMCATEERLGHVPTDEDKARIWNGGPNGWKKSSTVGYWNKVKALLK